MFILSLNVSRVVCVIIVFAPTLDVTKRHILVLIPELLLLGATKSYRPTDAIERPNGDRRCGESTIIFLQYVLTRIDRHICKTVMQQTSFHKINLGKKTLHVIIIVKTLNNECLSMLCFSFQSLTLSVLTSQINMLY